jgi:hypothetical protein
MRSDYKVVGLNGPRRIIFIEDLNLGRMSVTNDAEAVMNDVHSNYSGKPRVVYKDSDGLWWEMIPSDHPWEGSIIGFERFHGVAWDILKDKELK